MYYVTLPSPETNLKMKTTTLFSATVLIFFFAACTQNYKVSDVATSVEKHAVFSDGLLSQTEVDGWVEEFLRRQAEGLTGHPDAMSYPYNSCLWNGQIKRNTETYGCEWWRYEQTAYYSDGLLRLGYILDNEDFVRKITDGIEYTLANVDENGRIGKWIDRRVDAMWPICVYFRVLKAYYEKTGDSRIVEALHRHYLTYTQEEVETWRSIVSIEGMLWVYEKTGDRRLLEMSEKAWNSGKFIDLIPTVCENDEKMYMHGVTFCEELKLPVLLYAYTGNHRYLELALNALRKAERDDMLPDGVIASAEALVGSANVINSHETCDIADYTWTLGYFLMTTGESRWADKIEKAVFNACPGAITKDFKALQYFSSVNQVIATGTSNHNDFFHGSTWMAYRPTHETECCSGNVHRIMPNYVSRMWMTQGRDTLVAALYGPSEIEFKMPDGGECKVEEHTLYPFDGRIDFCFDISRKARIPFSFRIPEWCTSVSVELNGKPLVGDWRPGTFVTVDRKFRDGDCLSVNFGMVPKCIRFKDQGVYFMRGPLVFSYSVPQNKTVDDKVYANMNGKIPEEPGFDCWSITPTGDWNYAWVGTDSGDISLVLNPDADGYPFDPGDSPVELEIPVTKIEWDLEEGRYTPKMPETVRRISSDTETLRLVPYGSTELRITVFPVEKSVNR